MSTARHDIYIIEDGHGGAIVRPGAFAVSPCTCAIRFRNLTSHEATVNLGAGFFSPARSVLAPGQSGVVVINWAADPPVRAGAYDYTVTVNDRSAQAHSEPTIIIDL